MQTNGSKQIHAINQMLREQHKSISKLKLFDMCSFEERPKVKLHSAPKKQVCFIGQQQKIKRETNVSKFQLKMPIPNNLSHSHSKQRLEYADQDQLSKMNLSPVSRISLRNKKQQLQLQTNRKLLAIDKQPNIYINTSSKEISNISQPQFNFHKRNMQIKDIPFQKVQQYFQNHHQIFLANKNPELIYKFMRPLLDQFNLPLCRPFIKQYKNCTYFGEVYQKDANHQGFLILESQKKVYYGQMNTDKKHGKGTEIDFVNNIIYKGIFTMGKKKGEFQVIKPTEKYIGELMEDKYQGRGKLFTDVSIYNGYFSKGLRHGEGEQFFPETGLKISGTFIQNHFTNNQQKLEESRIFEHSRSLKRSRYKSKLYQNPQEVNRKSRLQESRFNYQGYNYDLKANYDQFVRTNKTHFRKSGLILKRRRSLEQEQPLARRNH